MTRWPLFFELLGWEVKASKDKPLEETFVALGVEFDLSSTTKEEAAFHVKNKPERVAEIQRTIRGNPESGQMPPAEASQLRGRLVFSNSQTFGRMGALAYTYLGRSAAEGGGA